MWRVKSEYQEINLEKYPNFHQLSQAEIENLDKVIREGHFEKVD